MNTPKDKSYNLALYCVGAQATNEESSELWRYCRISSLLLQFFHSCSEYVVVYSCPILVVLLTVQSVGIVNMCNGKTQGDDFGGLHG